MALKRSVGQQPRDDTKALEGVRRILKAHSRLEPYAAALRYAKENPEGVKPESTARRLADKIKKQDGIPTRAEQRKLLRDLGKVLSKALFIVEVLLAAMEKERPEE